LEEAMSYVPGNETAWNIGRFAAGPIMSADERQAGYFLRALVRNSQEIGRRVGSYQAAMAHYEAGGGDDYARRLRRQIRVEQQEQHIVEQMIGNLQHRFVAFDEAVSRQRSA
jgi:hypothetical protein